MEGPEVSGSALTRRRGSTRRVGAPAGPGTLVRGTGPPLRRTMPATVLNTLGAVPLAVGGLPLTLPSRLPTAPFPIGRPDRVRPRPDRCEGRRQPGHGPRGGSGGGQVPSMTCPTTPRPVTRRASHMLADHDAQRLTKASRSCAVRCGLVGSGVVTAGPDAFLARARPTPPCAPDAQAADARPATPGRARHRPCPLDRVARSRTGQTRCGRMVHNGRPLTSSRVDAHQSTVRALLDQPGGLHLGRRSYASSPDILDARFALPVEGLVFVVCNGIEGGSPPEMSGTGQTRRRTHHRLRASAGRTRRLGRSSAYRSVPARRSRQSRDGSPSRGDGPRPAWK